MVALAAFAMNSFAQTKEWPGVKDSLYSNVLKETRKIQIIFPAGYESGATTTYEMFYVLDGEWYWEHVPFIYNFTVTSGFAPPCIFVVLPNTYVKGENRRDRDFSPTHEPGIEVSGGADNFHTFLKDELIPYVEKKYPANGNRTLIGSSFSGLFSVYAFIKDPELFRSYISSDPNLGWDHDYVSKMAIEKLPSFTNVNSTLFIGAIDISAKNMGSAYMDSVLTKYAPPGLPWKFIAYSDETHYSVQHRAFYDAMRFSHLGFGSEPPQVHPNAAFMAEGKPMKLYFMNRNSSVRFTTDGTTPTLTSTPMKAGEFSVTSPSTLKFKAFPNRPEYAFDGEAKLTAGLLTATKSARPLQYKYYTGDWSALPDLKKAKPTQTGKVDKDFKFEKVSGNSPGVFIVDGTLDIQEEGYYIILLRQSAAVDFKISGITVIEANTPENMRTFGAYLRKGSYPVQARILRAKDASGMGFGLMRTTSSSDRWWENDFVSY